MFKNIGEMTRIIKQLFIFFFLLLIWQFPLAANRVSGLYAMPGLSVKFGADSPFSLLPVGWSKEGKAAFLVHWKADSSAYLIIIDTVDDSVVFQSEPRPVDDSGLAGLWNTEIELYSSKLSEASIIPESDPRYGGYEFTISNEKYLLFSESESLPGNRGKAALDLYIKSERRGSKKLYAYVHNDETERILMDYHILGYFQSPWERRVAVFSLEDYYEPGGGSTVQLRISGAHLTIGYVRDKSSPSRLLEAVLSGQFYTTRTLLREGADPGLSTPGGKPLVLMAAEQGNWDIVFLLLEEGADPAVTDVKRRTLLHIAAFSGDRDAVFKLISLGLNRKFRDEEGKSSLDLAREQGHSHLEELLAY